MPEAVALDCPDALEPALRRSLGADFAAVMAAMRDRAPLFLRVNLVRGDVTTAQAALLGEGIATRRHPLAATALEVLENPRKLRSSQAFATGLVELQDVASQAAAEAVPVPDTGAVLDYCAGGGGKTLALAARGATVQAHDDNPARMRDIPSRAHRAGVEDRVSITENPSQMFDSVVVDAPCSGSGAWRRDPDAKWRMTAERLDDLVRLQAGILQEAGQRVRPGGALTYITCSLIDLENQEQIKNFCFETNPWTQEFMRQFTPLHGGDGFFVARLRRGRS